MNHYIYIVHPIRFFEQNEPTYKIGKTTTNIFDYLSKKYSKSSKVIFASEVINCHQLERDIISLFDKIFVKRTDVGVEYYTGNVQKMKEIIALLMINEKVLSDATKELPKVKQYVKNKQEYVETLVENEVDDFEEHDSVDESDELESSANSNVSITPNINTQHDTRSGKSLKTFYKHIYTTKPIWFTENERIKFQTIENAYREYFDDNITTSSIISRTLNGKLFKPINNAQRNPHKKLVSFDELKSLFEKQSKLE